MTLSLTSKLISIVDDDPDIVNLFRDALQSLPGVSIFAFTDPLLALEHYKMNKSVYALVISDLKMPGMDGIELLSKIKRMNRSTQAILMTAFDVNDKLFQEYTEKGIIDGFLQKPIKLGTLIHEVTGQLHSCDT